MATDQELVEQIRRGEREAYAELFRKYYDYIYVVCLSMVKNPQDAEELAQEMFVHAYFKLDQLRNPARFFPWLKKMTHNRSRNYAQRTKAKIIQIPFSETQRKSAAPDEELLGREVMEAIMGTVEALPVRDREVIQARIDGLNHAEISERFGISIDASMTRLSRARRKLSDHLKGLYSVLGLSKILHLKEIISGGVLAMKIGIGTKVTIGVIGVLAVGIIGFHLATRQPDEAVLPAQAIQETSAKSPEKLEANQQAEDKKKMQTQSESTTASSDSSKESVTEEEAKEFLAFLDQLDNQEDSEEAAAGTMDNETTISPEVEAIFIAFKGFGDRIWEIRKKRTPYMESFNQLSLEEEETREAMNAAAINGNQSENERLARELTQIGEDKNKLALNFLVPLDEQSDEIQREREEYLQTHHGMTVQEFADKYREVYPAWAAER